MAVGVGRGRGARGGGGHRATPLWHLGRMSETVISISCDSCAMQHTAACSDCVVTFICDVSDGGVVFDLAEQRAVRLLASVGLVPTLRHREAI